jgi:hypothetical protein
VAQEEKAFSYPFTLDFTQTINSDGSFEFVTASDQKYLENDISRIEGYEVFHETSNHVASQNASTFSAQSVRTGHTGNSSQEYVTKGRTGPFSQARCDSRNLSSVNSVLTAYNDGAVCEDEKRE